MILWEGKSPFDGAPIVLIATGYARPSKNTKTGALLQTWILRQDVAPHDAVASGADASVCGDCPHGAGAAKIAPRKSLKVLVSA